MADKKIIVVGAGPGGLTAAMLCAHRGFDVTVFEREATVGGRNRAMTIDGFTHDTGPTFLMMDFILRRVFERTGRAVENYCELMKLDPMYTFSYPGKTLRLSSDRHAMEMEIERTFPGAGKGLHEFYRREERRFRKVFPCLNTSYSGYGSLLSPPLIGALPYLRLGKSVYDNVGGYFEDDLCKMAFTFQAKYLGMSPWKCPAFFTIIPYIEHTFGVYHVKGGLAKISEAMAKVVAEEGGKIVLNTAVDRVLVKDGIATGVLLGTGEKIGADAVVVNADFAYAMSRLFDEGVLKKYTPQKLASMKYSCSTFMLYLGLDTRYDEPHHNILMSNNYRRDIEDMLTGHVHSDNMSIYIRNAAATDPTLAPEGKSGLYILVPVSNTSSGIAWDDDLVEEYIAKVLGHIRQRTSMKDIERHIVSKRVRTPDNWRNDFLLYNGATFSLAHNLSQMLVFRPHNRFEEVRRCYLVGGGTHPGSGLPTIYQSGVISSALLEKDLTCS